MIAVQQAPRPFSEQITNLLKELHVIEHEHDPDSTPQQEDRRQTIRRELVQIVNRLGWRQGLPLRIWLHARSTWRIQ
jgi:hypothetical protein